MFRNQLDFTKISRAIDMTFQELQTEQVADGALETLKEAEQNLQQAINFSLSSPPIKRIM